jgi:hypothetical protein
MCDIPADNIRAVLVIIYIQNVNILSSGRTTDPIISNTEHPRQYSLQRTPVPGVGKVRYSVKQLPFVLIVINLTVHFSGKR